MPFDGRVYRIFIASPSDVSDERQIAVDAILEWNNRHSANARVVLMPIRWETHATPQLGIHPQEAINTELVDSADLLIGMFWTRLGTKTNEAESGTLEEIERIAGTGKQVMIYFSSVSANPSTIDLKQLERLRKFQKSIRDKCLYVSYQSIAEFANEFARNLDAAIHKLRSEESQKDGINVQFLDSKEEVGSSVTLKVPSVRFPTDFNADVAIRGAMLNDIRLHFANYGIFWKTIGLTLSNEGTRSFQNVFADFRLRSQHGSPVTGIARSNQQVGALDPFSRFSQTDTLTYDGNGEWRFTFSCPSLHAKRKLSLNPPIVVCSNSSDKIDVDVMLYSDAFTEPQAWKGVIQVECEPLQTPFQADLDVLFAKFAGVSWDWSRYYEFLNELKKISIF